MGGLGARRDSTEFSAPLADRSLRRGKHREYAYLASTDLPAVDAWSNSGGALSIIANRLSYFLDLRGPPSRWIPLVRLRLVAVHLACQSLRMQ